MAYFLKKNKKKDKIYLSIVNSFYDHQRGCAVHETYASYGTGKSLMDQGIEDPIAYLEDKVKQLNYEHNLDETKLVSDLSPYKHAGHFILKSLLNKLEAEPIFNIYDRTRNYPFHLFDVLSSLIYARCIKSYSEYKNYFEVLPYLEKECMFSYDQLLEALSYFGENYEKIVDIFAKLTKEVYGINNDVGYFDCDNFYFEIDKEDTIRRKDDFVSMGLLLDGNQIPIGLKLFPADDDDNFDLIDIIQDLKEQNGISEEFIKVADKGLYCAKGIYEARLHNDSYIFSRSVETLTETEKAWVLLENDYEDVYDQHHNLLYRSKECIDTFNYAFKDVYDQTISFQVTEKRVVTYNPLLARKELLEIEEMENKAKVLCLSYATIEEFGESAKYVDFKGHTINKKKLEADKKLCGYHLIVTSELNLDKKEIYHTYHHLINIEESFRMMKSELDANPAFVKSENILYGHFLICYLSSVLVRLIQVYELKGEASDQEIVKFIRDLKYVTVGNKYVNMITNQPLLDKLSSMTKLPLKNTMLTKKQYEKIMSYKL